MVEDFNTPLSEMDRYRRQKISKDIVEVNSHINQLDIYSLPHPTTAEHTFFSSSHGTFTKTEHNLRHKTHLNNFKIIEIIQYLFSDHSGIKSEINKRNIFGKIPKYLEIK